MSTRPSPPHKELTLFLFDGFDTARHSWVRGSWWAHSPEQAQFWLLNQGYQDISLRPSAKSLSDVRVGDLSLALFYRQVAVMFRAGLPLTDALRLASYTDDRQLAGVCLLLADQISSGYSLSKAMKNFPGVFDVVVVGLMGAAESSGRLPHMLGRLADAQEREYRLKKSVISALTYPAILCVSTLALAVLFFSYIFPINHELFGSMNLELPAINRWLTSILEVIGSRAFPVLLLALGGALVVMARRADFRQRLGERIQWLFMKVPQIHDVVSKARALRMLEILALLVGGGGTIDQALRFMIAASRDAQGKGELTQIRNSVINGADFGQALKDCGYFPTLVSSLLQIGYETGRMDEMARKGAELCEEDVRVALDTATSLIEPLLLAFAGLISGVAVVTSALPMLALIRGL